MPVSKIDARVAELLKEERLKQGLSIRALAEKAELVPSTVSRIEAKEQKPSLMVVLQLCKCLDISAPALVARLRDEEPVVKVNTDHQQSPSKLLKGGKSISAQQVDALLHLAKRLVDK